MADTTTNGDSALQEDIQMQDQSAPDLTTDPTDPQPAPQQAATAIAPQSAPLEPTPTNTEHLSTIQPAAPTSNLQPISAAATPSRPGSQPPTATATPAPRPDKPVPHGGPVRQYLNGGVTPHLLEGIKYLAVYQPDKPLAWLADFLKERSAEVEGA